MLPGSKRRLLKSEFAVLLRCLTVNANFVLVSSGLRRSRIRVMISARGECWRLNDNDAVPLLTSCTGPIRSANLDPR